MPRYGIGLRKVGIFFAAVMQAADLIFEAGAVMLIDDCWGDKDKEISFHTFIVAALKEVSQ